MPAPDRRAFAPDGAPTGDADAVRDAARDAVQNAAMLDALLDAVPAAFYAYDHEWRCVRLNDRARQALREAGLDPDEFLGRVLWDVVPDLVGGPFHAHGLRCARERVAARFEAANRRGAGWTETTMFPTAFGVAAYTHDIEDRRRAARREGLLVEAGALLSGRLDERETLAAVAELAVRDVADACLVTLRAPVDEASGEPPRLAVVEAASRDPVVARELRALASVEHGAPAFDAHVARTGRAELHAALGAAPSDVALALAPLVAALPSSPPASAMVAPLTVRERVVGTITFLRLAGPNAEPFDEGDLACAEELGRRTAGAIDNARLFAAERAARARAEHLQALTVALTAATSFADVADAVLTEGIALVGAAAGRVVRPRADGRLEVVRTRGWPPDEPAADAPILPDARVPSAEAMRTGEVTWAIGVQMVERFPAIAHLARRDGMRTVIGVPIRHEGAAFGAIGLALVEERAPSDDDRSLLRTMGEQCAQALERIRLSDAAHAARADAERAARRAARLAMAASAFSGASTVAEVTTVLLRESHAALGSDAALVALVQDHEVEIVDSIGYPDYVRGAWRRFPVDAPVPIGDAVRGGAPVHFASEAERARRYPGTPATGYEGGTVVPLASGGRLIGALALSFADAGRPDDDDRRLLDTLALQWAQALDRAQLYEAERAARAEAEAARQSAEAANRSKGEFLTVMSHELRTPLNAIAGYVQLLELGVRGPVTPEQRADLERIQTAQRTLLRRINDVLNFAKLEAGHVRFDLRDVSVAELLAGVEPLVAPQVAARHLTYVCEPCDPGLRVHVDPEKAGQVLLNLVSNAVKFTPAHGLVLLSAESLGTGRVAIRVRDTGVGIPAEKLPSVFEPFVQVDARHTRQHEGTGLGLAISRDLVRGMGGELAAESVLGVGSTFVITLPTATVVTTD